MAPREGVLLLWKCWVLGEGGVRLSKCRQRGYIIGHLLNMARVMTSWITQHWGIILKLVFGLGY